MLTAHHSYPVNLYFLLFNVIYFCTVLKKTVANLEVSFSNVYQSKSKSAWTYNWSSNVNFGCKQFDWTPFRKKTRNFMELSPLPTYHIGLFLSKNSEPKYTKVQEYSTLIQIKILLFSFRTFF